MTNNSTFTIKMRPSRPSLKKVMRKKIIKGVRKLLIFLLDHENNIRNVGKILSNALLVFTILGVLYFCFSFIEVITKNMSSPNTISNLNAFSILITMCEKLGVS